MINSANKYPIQALFNPETKVKYIVPKYQREYSWGRDNWDELLNDLSENESGYFLGSIILVNRVTDALGIAPLEVIDGQQRLITVSLIYAALYKRLLEIDTDIEDKEEFINEKLNLKNKLIQKLKSNELKVEPSFQNSNIEDYKFLLFDAGIYPIRVSQPKNFGNRRLAKAYAYFYDKIQDYTYNDIKILLDNINNALIVKIEVDNHSDAYILFQSLNDRGEPLLAIDLVKTSLLSELERKGIKTMDEAFEDWNVIIKNLTDDYSIQERFLRQYYNAFKYKKEIKIESKGFTKATKSNIIKIYNDNLIPNNPKYLLDDLVKKSDVYSKFVSGTYEGNPIISKNLLDLIHVGAATSYMFLLYLFSEYNENNFLEDVSTFLVKWYTRRNLTDYPATRDLDAIFMALINDCEIERQNGRVTTKFILDRLVPRMTTEEVLDEKLRGDIYTENAEVTRFILCRIEESHMTRERRINLWEKSGKNFNFTIEHIFPEGKNIPKDWVAMIAEGKEVIAKDYQEKYVHKLGNLTLSAYNSNLSNKSFLEKRDRKDNKDNNYIGYKNGLYLNQKLKDLDSWTIEDIKERTNLLVREATDLFAKCIIKVYR